MKKFLLGFVLILCSCSSTYIVTNAVECDIQAIETFVNVNASDGNAREKAYYRELATSKFCTEFKIIVYSKRNKVVKTIRCDCEYLTKKEKALCK